MNHEYKYTLIENESEYKDSLLKEIADINDELHLFKYLDKLISVQYYKGLFYDASEYSEILSSKINEIIDIEIKNSSYENNELKYFIKELLESYDLFLDELTFNIEITDNIKIKSKYLISELDSNYYLDELNDKYEISEISIYADKDEYIESYIKDIISCYILNKDSLEFIDKYFNYDEFISDESEDILIIFELENKPDAYIIDYNKLY